MLTYTYSPENNLVIITGIDLELINTIYQKVGTENRMCSINRPYRKPFLPALPKGQNAMSLSKDLNGIATLVIQCTDSEGLSELLYVLSNKFDLRSGSKQAAGTIETSCGINLAFTPYRRAVANGVNKTSSPNISNPLSLHDQSPKYESPF
jgi:hypothetical protein